MARLNIEETLWKDFRFQDLMIKTGNRHTAKGMILELWTLAQEFWFPNRQHIPPEKIREAGLQPVVDVGLAVLKDGGYFAIGSDTAFDWLFSASEKGKKGGKASAEKRKRVKKGKKESTSGEPQLNLGQAALNPSEASLLLPPSPSLSSFSSSNSEIYSVGESAPALPSDPGIKNPIAYFVGTYVKAFQERYPEARPELGGPVQGRIKAYLKGTDLQRACAMIRTYCAMNDSWFLTKCHDFETFMQNLGKVGVKLDTGRALTRGEVSNLDRKQTTLNAFGDLIAEAEAREAAEVQS